MCQFCVEIEDHSISVAFKVQITLSVRPGSHTTLWRVLLAGLDWNPGEFCLHDVPGCTIDTKSPKNIRVQGLNKVTHVHCRFCHELSIVLCPVVHAPRLRAWMTGHKDYYPYTAIVELLKMCFTFNYILSGDSSNLLWCTHAWDIAEFYCTGPPLSLFSPSLSVSIFSR